MNLNISSELKIYEKSKPKNRFKEIKEKKHKMEVLLKEKKFKE